MQGERELPSAADAERAVLGSVLIRPSSLDDVAGLVTSGDFFWPHNRVVFEAMERARAAGKGIDAVSLCDSIRARGEMQRLPEGETYMLDLSGSVPTAESAATYARIVRDKSTLRRLIAACADAQSRAFGCDDTPALLSELRATIAGLDVGGEGGPVRVGEDLPGILEDLERRAAKPDDAAGISTGLGSLNRVLGGLRAKNLIVVAGRPGSGKSSASMGFAVQAAKDGAPVLVHSLEMTRPELIERSLSAESLITGAKLSRGEIDFAQWKNQLGPAAKRLANVPLWIDDRVLTVSRLCAEARRWRAKHAPTGPAMLVVDYLGLVKPDRHTGSRAQDVGAMSRAFKGLAKELDVPLVLVCQLNRNSVQGGIVRKPVQSDLRDSGEIEQDADSIVFAYREAPIAGIQPGPYEPEDAILIVDKNRHGMAGVELPVKWDGRVYRFYEVDEIVQDPFATSTSALATVARPSFVDTDRDGDR